MLKRLGQRGDTIVEVLIAIGIMSLVLTAAYVTAHRNYLSMQDAQERGNALKLLERQTEALKAYNVQGHSALLTAASTSFCMGVGSDLSILTQANDCVVDSTGQTAAAGEEPAYTISITKTAGVSIGSGQDFMLKATWDSILGDSQASVQMEYGLY